MIHDEENRKARRLCATDHIRIMITYNIAEACVYESWGEPVNPDVEGGALRSQSLHQAKQGCFTHTVRSDILIGKYKKVNSE